MRRERSVFALTSAIGCAIVIFLSIGVAGMFSLFIPEYMAEYGYSKMEIKAVFFVLRTDLTTNKAGANVTETESSPITILSTNIIDSSV